MEVSQDQVLADIKKNILDEERKFLCQNLNPRDHFPYLRSKFLISQDDEERILRQETRTEKTHLLLDTLKCRGPKAFDELVNSIIEDRSQIFIAERLNTAVEEKRRKLTALFSSDLMTKQPTTPHEDEEENKLPKPVFKGRLNEQCKQDGSH